MTSPPRAWAEIDLAALDHNLEFARRHSGQKVMAIVKAGAYGHGLVELARHLDGQGLSYFGVANVLEARRLAEAGIETAIYLLGATFPEEREEVVRSGWTPCLSSFDEVDDFERLGRECQITVKAHLALDTGMGRGGFLPDQFGQALDQLSEGSWIQLTGVGSHLPVADEDSEFTRAQFAQFDSLIERYEEELKRLEKDDSPLGFHLSNSAGFLAYSSRVTNLIRPGLSLYGVSPLPEWQRELRPVMSLKSRVALIRELPAGHGVSYGRTCILERRTRVATIGVGYGDGLPRSLDGAVAYVLVNGQKAPLLGRVTMDQIMVDVSDLTQVEVGDEVEIFGENLPVSMVAHWSGTITWEVLTRLTSRVQRIFCRKKRSIFDKLQ